MRPIRGVPLLPAAVPPAPPQAHAATHGAEARGRLGQAVGVVVVRNEGKEKDSDLEERGHGGFDDGRNRHAGPFAQEAAPQAVRRERRGRGRRERVPGLSLLAGGRSPVPVRGPRSRRENDGPESLLLRDSRGPFLSFAAVAFEANRISAEAQRGKSKVKAEEKPQRRSGMDRSTRF